MFLVSITEFRVKDWRDIGGNKLIAHAPDGLDKIVTGKGFSQLTAQSGHGHLYNMVLASGGVPPQMAKKFFGSKNSGGRRRGQRKHIKFQWGKGYFAVFHIGFAQ